MQKNENGFGVVEALIILIIVGLLGVAGWLVYDRQKSNKNDHSTAVQKSDPQQVANKEFPPFNYTLPAHWSKVSCDADILLIYPDNDKATNCEDRTNLILVVQDTYTLTEPLHCLSD